MVIMNHLNRHTLQVPWWWVVLMTTLIFGTAEAHEYQLTGNQSFSTREIVGWLASARVNNENAAAQVIRDHYRRRGFYDATVQAIAHTDDSTTCTIIIHEGPEIHLGRIDVRWVDSEKPILPEPQVQGAFAGVASESALHRGLETLVQRLRDDGYHYAQVFPDEFSRREERLDFTVRIAPGARLMVAEWQITGTQRTAPHLVRRRLRLRNGVPWTRRLRNEIEQTIRSWDYLRLTGSLAITRFINDSLVVVTIPLAEPPVFVADGGLGYDGGAMSRRGVQGTMNVRVDNPFGSGRKLNFELSRQTPRTSNTKLQIFDPHIIAAGIGVRLQLHQRRHARSYEQLSLGIGFPIALSPTDQGIVDFTWNRILPLTAGNGVPNSRRYDLSATFTKTVIHGSGSRTTLSTSTSGSVRRVYGSSISGDETRLRFRLNGEMKHRRLLSSRFDLEFVGRGEGWLGHVVANSWGDEMYLGGPQSLKGYAEFAIPADAYVFLSTEIGYRLSSHTRMHTFVDYARYRPFQQYLLFSHWPVRWSAGIGTEARSRLGRTRLDIGWPLPGSLGEGIIYLRWMQGW